MKIMKPNYPQMDLNELDSLSQEEKAEAATSINKKFQVINHLRQRTNYNKKQEGVTALLNILLDKLLVLEHGLDGLEDAKAELDKLNKDK